jgi:hypothetical protein
MFKSIVLFLVVIQSLAAFAQNSSYVDMSFCQELIEQRSAQDIARLYNIQVYDLETIRFAHRSIPLFNGRAFMNRTYAALVTDAQGNQRRVALQYWLKPSNTECEVFNVYGGSVYDTY